MRKSGRSELPCSEVRLMRIRYEAEIGRLRRELDARGGGGGGGGAISPPDLPKPVGADGERAGYPSSLPAPSFNGESARSK